MTENRSDYDALHVDGESIKPFTSRNLDYDTGIKPAIAEDPDEETKSERGGQQQMKIEEDMQNQYATIADNLPASATEIDPTPHIKAALEEDNNNNTLLANPEDGKIVEDTNQPVDQLRIEN